MNINSISTGSVVAGVWANATRTLTADPATDAGAAALVWARVTRTLTSDPATDAGSGTIVWTHATRTLTTDPFTDGGGGTVVWAHATRTLTSDPATDAGAATLVWARATRALTAFGTAITVVGQAAQVGPTGGNSIDLQPAAGKIWLAIVGIKQSGSGAGALSITLWDGITQFNLVTTTVNGSALTGLVLVTNTNYLHIANGGNSGTSTYYINYIQFNA